MYGKEGGDMQIPSRYTIGVHTLMIIALKSSSERVTSDFIANSVGANPVIIRKTLGQLKTAGLIEVIRGKGGASLLKDPEKISLLDIYLATDSQGENGQLFGFHKDINPNCDIGSSMHQILDNKLLEAQRALENQLSQTSLAELMANSKELTSL